METHPPTTAQMPLLKRLWDGLKFDELPLSAYEEAALAKSGRKLEPTAKGFLAWRRGWLLFVTPSFIFATVMRCVNLIIDYSDRTDVSRGPSVHGSPPMCVLRRLGDALPLRSSQRLDTCSARSISLDSLEPPGPSSMLPSPTLQPSTTRT